MPTMFSLADAAARFLKLSVGFHVISAGALEEAGQIIEAEAKRVIGTYDYGWDPLKPDTIERKGGRDTPLLDTGEMRDSIEHRVEGDKVFIGSDNLKAQWHEYGTSRGVPPRPFLSTAAAQKQGEIREKIGKHAADAILESLVAGRVVAPIITGVQISTVNTGGMWSRIRGGIGRLFGR